METIHSKAAHIIAYIISYILLLLLTIFICDESGIRFKNETVEIALLLVAPFSGILVIKELFEAGFLSLEESDHIVKKVLLYPLGITMVKGWALLLLISGLVSYIVLSPLYFIYFIGFIFGKGFNSSKN